MVGRNVSAFLKCQAVELVGHIEHTVFKHLFQLEIIGHFIFAVVEAFFANHIGKPVPIPRLDFEIAALFGDLGVENFGFALLSCGKRGDHLLHEFEREFGLISHIAIHRVACPIGLAEQFRFLRPQSGDLGD